MVKTPQDGDYAREFHAIHLKEYGFNFEDKRAVIIDNIRVRSLGSAQKDKSTFEVQSYHHMKATAEGFKGDNKPIEHTKVFFEIDEKI